MCSPSASSSGVCDHIAIVCWPMSVCMVVLAFSLNAVTFSASTRSSGCSLLSTAIVCACLKSSARVSTRLSRGIWCLCVYSVARSCSWLVALFVCCCATPGPIVTRCRYVAVIS